MGTFQKSRKKGECRDEEVVKSGGNGGKKEGASTRPKGPRKKGLQGTRLSAGTKTVGRSNTVEKAGRNNAPDAGKRKETDKKRREKGVSILRGACRELIQGSKGGGSSLETSPCQKK